MQFMEKDHDRLDGIFKSFQKSKNASFFHDFKIGLQRHIIWEEDILFPIFEDKTGMKNVGPTEVMRMEHRQIKEFLEKIHDTLGEDTKVFENGLLNVLIEHNNKEESILYPSIDNEINEKELASIFKKMKSIPVERYNRCC